jgi:hypothetical protein
MVEAVLFVGCQLADCAVVGLPSSAFIPGRSIQQNPQGLPFDVL